VRQQRDEAEHGHAEDAHRHPARPVALAGVVAEQHGREQRADVIAH